MNLVTQTRNEHAMEGGRCAVHVGGMRSRLPMRMAEQFGARNAYWSLLNVLWAKRANTVKNHCLQHASRKISSVRPCLHEPSFSSMRAMSGLGHAGVGAGVGSVGSGVGSAVGCAVG